VDGAAGAPGGGPFELRGGSSHAPGSAKKTNPGVGAGRPGGQGRAEHYQRAVVTARRGGGNLHKKAISLLVGLGPQHPSPAPHNVEGPGVSGGTTPVFYGEKALARSLRGYLQPDLRTAGFGHPSSEGQTKPSKGAGGLRVPRGTTNPGRAVGSWR